MLGARRVQGCKLLPGRGAEPRLKNEGARSAQKFCPSWACHAKGAATGRQMILPRRGVASGRLSPGDEKDIASGRFSASRKGPPPNTDPLGATALMSSLAGELAEKLVSAINASESLKR